MRRIGVESYEDATGAFHIENLHTFIKVVLRNLMITTYISGKTSHDCTQTPMTSLGVHYYFYFYKVGGWVGLEGNNLHVG